MAKKFKVKTKAVFDGRPIGSTIEMDEDLAKKYEALKYLEIIGEVKQAKKATSEPKKPAKTLTKNKPISKDK